MTTDAGPPRVPASAFIRGHPAVILSTPFLSLRTAEIHPMKRVLVIGSGGAGKSTFATALAERTGLPLVHLDALFWRPGWVETPRPEWAETVQRVIAGDRWILDGNYGGTLPQRMAACDTVIFLDLPRLLCATRALRRWFRFRGGSRPDMAPGCPERPSLAFLWWIWTYPTRRRPEILRRLGELRSDQRAVILRSRREVSDYLDSSSPSPAQFGEEGVRG